MIRITLDLGDKAVTMLGCHLTVTPKKYLITLTTQYLITVIMPHPFNYTHWMRMEPVVGAIVATAPILPKTWS